MSRSSFSLWLTQRSLILVSSVAALGLTVTLSSWHILRGSEQEAAHERFSRGVLEITRELDGAMARYERLLRAGSSLFNAGDDISRQEWHQFAENMRLEEDYPGMQGFGFAPLINAHDKDIFEARVRKEGFQGYEIRTEGAREAFIPVLYIEPFMGRNLRAFGFDMFSEANRRAAAEQARDSGQVSLSGKVVLKQETESPQAGTLMFIPSYLNNMPTETVEQRRKALRGFVFAPFRMDDLMTAALRDHADELAFEIYDGKEPLAANRLYSRRMELVNALPGYVPHFEAVRHIDVAGRQWTLRFATLPVFETAAPASRAQVVLFSGLGLTLLLCILVASLATMRVRAEQLADRMSRAYRESEARIRSIIDGAAEGIVITESDPAMTILKINSAGEQMLGLPATEANGRSLAHLLSMTGNSILHDLREGTASSVWLDTQYEAAKGQWRSLSVAITVAEQDSIQRLIVLISDQTALHQARQQALMAGALNEAILLHSPFCIFSTDPEGRLRTVNPAGERLLGYSRTELVDTQYISDLLDTNEYSMKAEQLSQALGRTVTEWESFVRLAQERPEEEHECGFVCRGGVRIPVNLAVTALRDQANQITGYLGIAYDITERKRAEELMRYQALHDSLTGLPNRTLMTDRMSVAIERAKRNQEVLGVMLMDLDRFKEINDTLGHDVGDEVLKQVAHRLKNAVRQSDTVVRLGGDEFVILLGDLRRIEDASNVATKILKAIEADLIIGPHRFYLSTSIGIALYPEQGADLDELLKNADRAMYEVKRRGKKGFALAQISSMPRDEIKGRLV
ncbi:CHASE domain-containing protein [Pseudomonas asuensis]|uniref:sensor domain-containing diguanylate cyclase n=1 Tax=Pseudomonas asuensis TaxID=1825787 RepID=UPI00166C3D37|nr:CHASE domain-containing protein [Pseudomonas asuensis]